MGCDPQVIVKESIMISHVLIENFRGFKKAVIPLSKTHALVGENATGKTSVLEAINFATSPYYVSSRIDEQDFNDADKGPIHICVWFNKLYLNEVPDGFVRQNIPCGGVELVIKRREKAAPGRALSDGFVVEHYSLPATYNSALPLNPASLPDEYRDKIPSSVAQTESGWRVERRSSGKVMELSKRSLSLSNDLIGYPSVFYFDRMRENETKIGFNSLLQKITKDLNWRYRNKWDEEATELSWETYYRSVIDTVEETKQRQIVAPLREKMRDFLGKNFDPLEISLLNVEQPFTKAFFSLRQGVHQVDQSGLGSGVSILLALGLLEVISELSKEEIVFLIDEPELHFHPQVQSKLFHHFKTTDHQTIYTTQSDLFVDVSEWRCINRFSPEFKVFPEENTLREVVAEQPISVHLDEIKRYHRHECVYFREDNQILFARKALLVEGPAEKYAIPILARLANLELSDLTIISCNGKNKINDYQLLCKAYGIPYFTLFDLDSKPDTDAENQRIAEWKMGDFVHAFETSFERLFGIGEQAEHKASRLLNTVDQLTDAKEIPDAIAEAIRKISTFSRPT